MEDLLTTLKRDKVIAILRGVPNDRIVDTLRALTQGGIRFAEITFDQRNPPCAAMAIHLAVQAGLTCVGAGTVMTPEQVDMAADAGARYIISPNSDREVIARTKERGLLSMPGAFSPSEVAEAWKYGADVVKIFPADVLGTAFIKALTGGPYAHIPLTAVGGIHAGNARSFLDAGCIGVAAGGKLVDRRCIAAGQWSELEAKAREFCRAVAQQNAE